MKAGSRCVFVAIVGGSGAGKSRLAAQLEAALAPHAARISLDDFYRDRSHVSPSLRRLINFDKPAAIDWATFEAALDEWAAGRQALVPEYSFETHCRKPALRKVRCRRFMLIDGLWLLRRPSLRRRFDLKIYIDCSKALRLKRRCARDQQARGRDLRDVRRQFKTTVDPMHCRFVEPQKKWADLILPPDFGPQDVRKVVEVICGQ